MLSVTFAIRCRYSLINVAATLMKGGKRTSVLEPYWFSQKERFWSETVFCTVWREQ